MEQELLNIQQAAKFLGVNIRTKGLKVGTRGDWRFTKEDLLQMVKRP